MRWAVGRSLLFGTHWLFVIRGAGISPPSSHRDFASSQFPCGWEIFPLQDGLGKLGGTNNLDDRSILVANSNA
jgi:hypothetical protein